MSIQRKGPPTAAASFIRAINEAVALRHERKQRAEAEAAGKLLIRLAKRGQPIPHRLLSNFGRVVELADPPSPDCMVRLGKPVPHEVAEAYLRARVKAGHSLLLRQSKARAKAAKVKRAEAAQRHQDWQALADEVWRRNASLSPSAVARLIKGKAGASVDRIRRYIRKPSR